MAENYNKRHRAIPLPALKPEQNVHIRDRKEDGVVQESANNSPRSYNVKTPSKTIRRNRRDLISIPNDAQNTSNHGTRTRSGRVSKPPDRLNTPEIQPQ